MNYLGIISLCLGLISILITIQYINSTEKITDEIKYIRNKCMTIKNSNISQDNIILLIENIKKKYGLTLKDIKDILVSFDKNLNIESFTNYNSTLSTI